MLVDSLTPSNFISLNLLKKIEQVKTQLVDQEQWMIMSIVGDQVLTLGRVMLTITINRNKYQIVAHVLERIGRNIDFILGWNNRHLCLQPRGDTNELPYTINDAKNLIRTFWQIEEEHRTRTCRARTDKLQETIMQPSLHEKKQ